MSNQGICLNIGCGLRVSPEWINVDASPSLRISKIPFAGRLLLKLLQGPKWPKSVIYGDIVKGLKIPPNSCRLISAQCILEHLSLPDFHTALDNIYSYLVPGGCLRLIAPDLAQYIEHYRQCHTDPALRPQAAHEFANGLGMGLSQNRRNLFQRFKEALSNSRHQWAWDEASLSAALTQHYFINIRRSTYGNWFDQRFRLVETEERYTDSICLEGFKHI